MKVKALPLKRARVDILPLMDCMFLLLVFFFYMMLFMVRHEGIKVDLPSAASASNNKKEFIAITIDNDNRVFYNKTLVTLKELGTRLSQTQTNSSKSKASPRIYLAGDKAASYQTIIKAIDIIRQAGITKISLETSPSPPLSPSPTP